MSDSETSYCSLRSLHLEDQETNKTPEEACGVLPGRGLILVDDLCAMSPIALRQDDSFETQALSTGLTEKHQTMIGEEEATAGISHVKPDSNDDRPAFTEPTLINTEKNDDRCLLQYSGSRSPLEAVLLHHQHDLVSTDNEQLLQGQNSCTRDDCTILESTRPAPTECEKDEERCDVVTNVKAPILVEHTAFSSGPTEPIEGQGSDPLLSRENGCTKSITFQEPPPYHTMEANSVNEENKETCSVATNQKTFMSVEHDAFASGHSEVIEGLGSDPLLLRRKERTRSKTSPEPPICHAVLSSSPTKAIDELGSDPFISGRNELSGRNEFRQSSTFHGPPAHQITEVNSIKEENEEIYDDSQAVCKALNDSTGSAFSTGSYNDIDIDSCKEKVGASSKFFLEHLRGAATRRKNQVIQSRDSLVAKQQQLQETNTKFAAAVSASHPTTHSIKTPFTTKTIMTPSQSQPKSRPFKALPMPTLGGSHVGIPKVDKKPPTTPCSPLLGARRLNKTVVKALVHANHPPVVSQKRLESKQAKPQRRPLEKSASTSKELKPSDPMFHARPIPRGFDRTCVGIPKVSKRPTTVPVSPVLGVRRQPTTTTPTVPRKSENSLEGLKLLSASTKETTGDLENRPPNTPLPFTDKLVFTPHSTRRAQQRADYDKQRAALESQRQDKIKGKLNREIRAKRMELNKMRQKL